MLGFADAAGGGADAAEGGGGAQALRALGKEETEEAMEALDGAGLVMRRDGWMDARLLCFAARIHG